MNNVFIYLTQGWTWRMCWRESRQSRARLLLFSYSIVLGVAALAAIGSLGRNLERAIDQQAKTLLGADLEISSREPFSPAEDRLFASLGGVQSRETAFSSMIYFPSGGGTRLAQIRCVSGGFPFYGKIETDPPDALAAFRRGAGALVEDNLLIQFDAKPGQTIRIGKAAVPIAGALLKVPGESAALATVSPRVYLPAGDLDKTGLVKAGSLMRYRAFFAFPDSTNVETLVKTIKPQLDKFRLGSETVAQRKEDLGRALENLNHFLNLAGLMALLLGGIGVASAVHVHVKQKLPAAAILRCLGAPVAQTFAVYLAQGIALGVMGAVLGCALGLVVQAFLPPVIAYFIPFDYVFQTAWMPIARAGLAGWVICLLFAILPLLEIRRVPPLAAMRAATGAAPAGRDPARWAAGTAVAVVFLAITWALEHNLRIALSFAAGLAVVFGALALAGTILLRVLRRWIRPALPFVLRQGLSGLHRPNNRTFLLLFALGLGTFLMTAIGLTERMLQGELVTDGGPGQPNAILFDIQPSQEMAVAARVRSLSLPVLDELPIVAMRIDEVKGRSVESLLSDTNKHIPGWTLRREYRSTYSDHLRSAERVVAGHWIARFTNATGAIPISMDQDLANDLQVRLGDSITFGILGEPIETRIASLREIEWRRAQPNFFVVFPDGSLADAPAMDLVVTRVDSSAQSAALQRAMVKEFPNVSVIDLTLILQTVNSILTKVSLVIEFMALFTVATGMIVLVSSLVTGHYQRVRESILLRTLGASRRQIYGVLAVEYLSLGGLSAVAGTALALGAAGALAHFLFHVRFVPAAWPVAAALLAVPALTGGIGLFMCRGILDRPPLAALREAE